LNTGKKIRPQIDEDFVYRIKSKYPKETARMNDMEAIAWALEQFLNFQEIFKEAGAP